MSSPPTSASDGRRAADVRLRAGLVDAFGALALLGTLYWAATSHLPPWWTLLLLAGLLGPAVSVELPLRLGNRRVQVAGLFEAALTVSLAVYAGPWIPLVVAAAIITREMRLRRPLDRLLVNTSVFVGPTTLGVLLLEALPPASGLLSILPVLAAIGSFTVLNELLLAWVVAGATGGRLLPTLREDAATTGLGLAVNIALALAVLTATSTGQWAVLLAAPLALTVVMRRYRRRLLADTTSDALPRLRQAAERLEAIAECQAVAEVLHRAMSLFALERVELALRGWPASGDRTHTLAPSEQLQSRAGVASLPGTDPRVLSAPLVTGSTEATELLGELRLTFACPPALTDAEQQVLDTFVSATAASLAQARMYAEQAHAARTDPLTGLGNRLALRERIEHQLPGLLDTHADSTAAPAGLAVLLIDLDHFKDVNDTLGHAAGDALLVQFAGRLTASLRAGDLAVRLGGDEFAVVLQDITTGQQALRAASTLLDRLSPPVLVEGLQLPIEASVGAALCPGDSTSVEGLLRCADIAMYAAKSTHATVVYDPSLDPASEQRLQLVSQLQPAIGAGQIVVHYQPIVCLRTAAVIGAEALVRWQHPDRGLLPPGAFVPAVERTALIIPLTLAVLDQAVRQAVTWPTVDGHIPGLSVNLSPRCLLVRELPDQVARVLASHGLPARRLTLEITETLALSELDIVNEVLTGLRDLGVRLSVDDFGTGYSSMSFLRTVAVDEVKIDRSFVGEATTSRGARAIVHATVALAHGLGLPVVGEGVETMADLQALLDSGCDQAQGYLLGRPMTAVDLYAVLGREHPTVRRALESSSRPGPAGSVTVESLAP